MAPGLHAFGDDDQAEIVGEADDVGADGLGAPVAELADQAPVDLDRAQMQAVEVAEAGIAGAEIVERDGHAQPAQLLELVVHARVVVEQHVLGELELDQRRRDVGGLDQLGQAPRDAAAAQLRGRKVDRDPRRRDAAGAPAADLAQGVGQDPGAQGLDQPGLLGQRQERAGASVPRCGWCQRRSASSPVTAPSAAAILGW